MNCEDLYTDRQWKVCQAFATFVARRTEAGKVSDNQHNMAARESQTKAVPTLLFVVFFLCAQVQLKQVIPRTQLEQMEYSLAAERRRMRLLHAEIITDLLSSSTAQPGTGSTHGGSVTQWRCGQLTSWSCFGFPRRMPGVPGRRAGREDASGERGAGAAAAYEPPSQHLWWPDHGVDGERGYDFCKVCTNSLNHPLPSYPLENTKVFQV